MEAGTIVPWRTEAIPVGTERLIVATGRRAGQERAFDWLRATPDRMQGSVSALSKKLAKQLLEEEKHILAAIGAEKAIEWNNLTAARATLLSEHLVEDVLQSTLHHVNSFGVAWGADMVDEIAIEWAKRHAYEHSEYCTKTLQKQVARVLEEGERELLSRKELTERVHERLSNHAQGFSAGRAQAIALTEVTYATEAGSQLAKAELARVGVDVRRRWSYTWSGKEPPCHACLPFNNVVEDANGLFTGNDGMTSTGPALHVNCYCFTYLVTVEDLMKEGALEAA
jgi:hypothetical protein